MLSKLQSLLQWNFSPLLVNSLIKTSICFWVLKGYELLLKVGMSARSLSSRPPDSSFWGIWSCVLLGFHESPLFFYTIFRYPVNSFVDFWGFPLLICLEYVFFFSYSDSSVLLGHMEAASSTSYFPIKSLSYYTLFYIMLIHYFEMLK